MGIKSCLKGAIIGGAMVAFGASAAVAQVCEADQFSSEIGNAYLAAENAAMVEKKFGDAINKLNALRAKPLNCYEEGAVLKLSAYIKIENGDRAGAVQDLLSALNKGYIAQKDAPQTYYNIAQIYLQENDLPKALEYMTKWQTAGGKPDRTQKWQLAVLNQKADRFQEALKWAEAVRKDDAPELKKDVADFLIYLYNKTGQKAKLSALVEELLVQEPNNRKYWDIISGGYFQDNQERKAFEVQKAMYLGGILKTEDELMRIVNFYNRFNAPYHGAKVLEKEMNAGRITKNLTRLELLANLYQVAREHEKAIPVIREAANAGGGGAMYERLGRSYADLQNWDETEKALQEAIKLGGIKDKGTAWVMIGQSRYERDDRSGAAEAFRNAGNRAGRSWIAFMDSEVATAVALRCFEAQAPLLALQNEKKVCKRLSVLGEGNMPEGCNTIEERTEAAQAKFEGMAECART
jgi:lipopolysaccharide biosynthesis regulator YciM